MEENLILDDSVEEVAASIPVKEKPSRVSKKSIREGETPKGSVSCLRNEKITVRYISKQRGMITNPKHVFYGGMGENSKRVFTVPILSSTRTYKNILTDEEKAFLEEYMGLEYNDLSIYKKVNNYWSGYKVELTKYDTILHLSNPDDYIKYKVLLANSDLIAPSLEVLQNTPKATYQFVLVSEEDEAQGMNKQLSYNQRAYVKFGEYQKDPDTLKLIIETIDGRPIADNTKLDFLQAKIGEIILNDAKLFCKIAEDPYLKTKVLIRRAHNAGILVKRGTYYYTKKDNIPLCEDGEEPTLSSAARYLNAPKHQELKFSIEAQLE